MVSSMSGSPQGHIRVVFHQFLLELANLTTSFNHNFSTQVTEVQAGDVWNEQVAFYHSITLRGGQLQKGESQKSLETSNLNRYGGCELACMCDITLSYDRSGSTNIWHRTKKVIHILRFHKISRFFKSLQTFKFQLDNYTAMNSICVSQVSYRLFLWPQQSRKRNTVSGWTVQLSKMNCMCM